MYFGILFLLPLIISAQDCENDIEIVGSNYVCENEIVSYQLTNEIISSSAANWSLLQAGAGTFTTTTTGNVVMIEWDGGPGVYDLVFEATDYTNANGACVGTFDDTMTIEVVSDFALQLACNDTVQVSLGTDCRATITPDMVLEGGRITNEDYNVYVMRAVGDTIPGAMLDGSHAGQLLMVSVEHDCSTNSCWGWLRIEDKIAPELECMDVMLPCTADSTPTLDGVPGFPFDPTGTNIVENADGTFTVNGLDSCGPVTLSYTDFEQGVNCIGESTTSTLYGVRRGGRELLELDPATGGEISSIDMVTTLDLVLGTQGLAVDPSTNQIYVAVNLATMFGGLPTLAIVDPTTGVLDIIGSLGDEFAGIAFNALGDKLYGVTGGRATMPETLFEINKYDASVSVVCPTGTMGMGEAIATNSFTDEFFHLTNEDDTMQTIDLQTCAAMGIDLSGTDLQGDGRRPTALAFDVTTGDFIIAESNANGPLTIFPNTRLYRLTPDGDVTFIGQRFGRIKGMGFVVNTPKVSEITRTWTVEDGAGNTDQCVQSIMVRSQSLLEVICPPNFDNFDEDALQCDGGFATDKNGNPSPSVTGYPSGVECSNLDYDYVDYKLGICESSYKIVREWLIADWCTGEQSYCNQIIKVIDDQGPVVTASEPCVQLLSSDPFECKLSSYLVPHPILDPGNKNESVQNNPYVPVVTEECGSYTYTVRHKVADISVTDVCDCSTIPANAVFDTKNVTRNRNGQYELTDIPIGCNWIEYVFEDRCGNESTYTIDIFVEEDQKPVAICDQHTKVTLSSTGTAKVFAKTFDDGSYDNCEVDSFAVRRMNAGNCPTGVVDDTQFRDFVEFCCNDVANSPIMVVFRVYDKSGNYNDCMVEITVVDKNAPELVCPPNIEVSCEYAFADLSVFGDVQINGDTRENIIIDDVANPGVPRNNNWGLDGYASDDCVLDTTLTITDNRNDCGVGTITRRWTASDANTTVSCTQIITFTDFEPFDGLGIRFPSDRTLTSCPNNLDPSVTGEPILPNTGKCADLLVTYKDEVFNIVPDACYKVLRNWTVVDWCNNDQQTNKWSDVQVIKILNTNDPEFVTECKDTTFKTVVNANCTGVATLEVEVTDDCTPKSELILEYKIDLDRDGTIDFSQVGDSSLTATNTYPEGRHEICWTVEDKCGNRETCCYEFEMEDGKKPTPYCRPGIVTVVMPTSGAIEIWASDFNDNSFDNCTEAGDLRYSFSANVNDTRREYTCSDIPNGIEESFELTVYVTDEAGNQDFCITQVTIQDGIDDVCPDNVTGNVVNVSGSIVTEGAETVEDVMVMLDDQSTGIPKYKMTDVDGQYAFPSVPMDHSYAIGASRNDDHMNGVSTLDLVLIQRHLLGISSFNSPYKHIAADVNNSNSVSAADISELRKLILGHFSELPRNQSWRFVTKDFQFADPTSPWPFDELLEIDDMSKQASTNDFIAVKTGDISGDAKPNGLIGNVVRTGEKLEMTTQDQSFIIGEQVVVDLQATATDIYGLQFAVQFDQNVLQLTDIQHPTGWTHEGHIGLTKLEDGIIQLSWNAQDGQPRDLQNGLISFEFEAIKEGVISDVMTLHTKSVSAEAYLTDLEVVDIEMNFLGKDGKVIASSEEFELYQNMPNPFDGTTTIAFSLPRMEEASIHIFDVTGKTVHLIQGVFAKGRNEITVGKSQLNTSGVLYYRLETNDQMATRKMIMIE